MAEALILGTMMVGQAVAFAPNYSKARVAASQIFALLDRRPVIDTSAGVGLRLVSAIAINILLQKTFYSVHPLAILITDAKLIGTLVSLHLCLVLSNPWVAGVRQVLSPMMWGRE